MDIEKEKMFLLLDLENFYVDTDEVKLVWLTILEKVSALEEIKQIGNNSNKSDKI